MKTTDRRPPLIAFFVLFSVLCPLSSVFPQGSLTPPGAPAPTFKTLQQIEPRLDLQNAPASAVDTTNAAYHFIINQPGSYYLSANLGVIKTNGIQINTEGVTLDLNGFQTSRASGSGGNGIEIPVTSHRASIRNGSIKGFAFGIRSLISGNLAWACAFRDLAVSNCTTGILAGEGAVLESCRAHDNSGAGIVANEGSTLMNCTAFNNTASYGIFADSGSSLTNCSAHNNTGNYGIWAFSGCSLTNCSAYNNTATYGIFASAGSSLTNCSAYSNDSSATPSAGIGTSDSCTITHCTAYDNGSTATSTPTTGMGFDVGISNTIQGCTASVNEGDGINISSDTVARDNTCDSNGSLGDGAGIHATGSDNRIEGNNVTDNDRGIDVDFAGNLIIKNSAAGNTTNYEIAADNSYGTIVDDSAGGAPAVSGNSAVSSFGLPNSWANFTY